MSLKEVRRITRESAFVPHCVLFVPTFKLLLITNASSSTAWGDLSNPSNQQEEAKDESQVSGSYIYMCFNVRVSWGSIRIPVHRWYFIGVLCAEEFRVFNRVSSVLAWGVQSRGQQLVPRRRPVWRKARRRFCRRAVLGAHNAVRRPAYRFWLKYILCTFLSTISGSSKFLDLLLYYEFEYTVLNYLLQVSL